MRIATVDQSTGALYVSGGTGAVDFPTTGGQAHAADLDAFVSKFAPTGELLWSRLYGGPGYDRAYEVSLSDDGTQLLVCGRAGPSFPTTSGVYQPTFAGAGTAPESAYGPEDGFAMKLNTATGNVIWATYFGDAANDINRSCDLDAAGNVYLGWHCRDTCTRNGTAGAFRVIPPGNGDSGVAKLSADGTTLIWFTYISGATGNETDNSPQVHVERSTGRVFFKTSTTSTDFPLNAAGLQTLVNPIQSTYSGGSDLGMAVVSADGSALEFSSYLGGPQYDNNELDGIAEDASGNMVICIATKSDGLPGTTGHFQTTNTAAPAGQNAYYATIKVSDPSSVLRATYLGGTGGAGQNLCHVDAATGRIFAVNNVGSGYPVTSTAYQPSLLGTGAAGLTLLSGDYDLLRWSSYFGGTTGATSGRAAGWWVSGNVLFAGGPGAAATLPMRNSFQSTKKGSDGWVAGFMATAPPTWTPTATPNPTAT